MTTKPIPVWGGWKTTLRLQKGRAVLGLPIFMPEDRAIPVKGIPALPQVTHAPSARRRSCSSASEAGISPALWTVAYLAVLVLALALLAGIVLGLRRIERSLSRVARPAAGRRPAAHAPRRARRLSAPTTDRRTK